MLEKKGLNLTVGMFIVAGALALTVLALKVSGFSKYSTHNAYTVMAIFDNIGDLKVRAPVTIAGVRVGEVASIVVDHHSFHAKVQLRIDKQQDQLPSDTSAKILTAGVIGANYVELIPGFNDEVLKDGMVIEDTQSAIVLENLIGQVIYSLTSGNSSSSSSSSSGSGGAKR